ncbi:MAG TPA: serine protease [Gemmataceae bacterium]|nr:serine protease [Gemmataceae bacterium]
MQRFTWVPRRVLPGTTVAALCLAFAGVGRADTRVYQGLLRSTGLVEVPDRQGSVTYGTCWVVDRRRGLAVTTQHVIGDSTDAVVYFPVRRDAAAVTELAYYHQRVAAVRARVIHCEVRKDLALLGLEALPDDVEAIPLSEQSARPGNTVHSIGNSGVEKGRLWRYTAGQVRSVYRARLRRPNVTVDARFVETQSAINPGDSGAPLVNDRGELVGVVRSMDEQSNLVSLNVDVSEVKALLSVAFWNQVQPLAGALIGLRPQPAPGAAAEQKYPPVQGPWKVTLINLDGEQQSGECRFEVDGTFTLSAHDESGPQTRQGRYSYANGVLLMARDRAETRETLHWVQDRRFTLFADEMLIFDRQPAVAAESPRPKAPAIECPPPPTEKTGGLSPPASNQLLEYRPGTTFPGGSIRPADAPSTSMIAGIALLGATCVIVPLTISAWSRRKSASRTTRSGELVPVGRQPRG